MEVKASGVANLEGTFEWRIPWYVRLIGSTDEFRVAEVRQLVVTDAQGNMTISKAGASLTKNLNDPTSNYGQAAAQP